MDASACAGVACGFARYIELASVPLASYLVGSGPSELFGFMFHVSDRERATKSQGPHGGAVHHAAAQRCAVFQTRGVSARKGEHQPHHVGTSAWSSGGALERHRSAAGGDRHGQRHAAMAPLCFFLWCGWQDAGAFTNHPLFRAGPRVEQLGRRRFMDLTVAEQTWCAPNQRALADALHQCRQEASARWAVCVHLGPAFGAKHRDVSVAAEVGAV